ncbi:transcriptional regulator [Limnobaculum zhutongyuii]|uniref:Transcriptional regulator n=1 Tax=Limnobaculum zhutongyuii TaxID=2498113 RepID=A0A411WHH6_9GAMM|nr:MULTISPECIES: helix-turn-helix transcriptional regulator [Limnobaculum]QBH95494.1 transcriptional regulator [Limnobaculum zhutongyuii]TQS88817.1 transcriptional regulator [Limnobaculum zhutongyuii]
MHNCTESQKLTPNGINNLIDWHPADIISALKKRGTNLSRLSRESGLGSRTLHNTLYRKWPKGEILIANALNVQPDVIWPSRY